MKEDEGRERELGMERDANKRTKRDANGRESGRRDGERDGNESERGMEGGGESWERKGT